uniref:DUF834 domain-containing protein n=1 Tax=Oryza punctata TaxID=4537 RepID=A0A0E0KYW3_ORYPU
MRPLFRVCGWWAPPVREACGGGVDQEPPRWPTWHGPDETRAEANPGEGSGAGETANASPAVLPATGAECSGGGAPASTGTRVGRRRWVGVGKGTNNKTD